MYQAGLRKNYDLLLETLIQANILTAANHLRHGSQTLEEMVQQGKLTIVRADYSLKTEQVEFFCRDLKETALYQRGFSCGAYR